MEAAEVPASGERLWRVGWSVVGALDLALVVGVGLVGACGGVGFGLGRCSLGWRRTGWLGVSGVFRECGPKVCPVTGGLVTLLGAGFAVAGRTGAIGAGLVGVVEAFLGRGVSLPGSVVALLGLLVASVGALHQEPDALLGLEQRDLTQDRLLSRLELVGLFIAEVAFAVSPVGGPVTAVGLAVAAVGLAVAAVGLGVPAIRSRIDDAALPAGLGGASPPLCGPVAGLPGLVSFGRGGVALVGGLQTLTGHRLPLQTRPFSLCPRLRVGVSQPAS